MTTHTAHRRNRGAVHTAALAAAMVIALVSGVALASLVRTEGVASASMTEGSR